MRGSSSGPSTNGSGRYETLRAFFIERLPARVVAERFGYSLAYIHLLWYLFAHRKIDFSEPVP